jgi:hypothetical protein
VPEGFDGVGLVMSNLRDARARQVKDGARALLIVGKLILRESNKHVPHEEGDFERGGRVTSDGVNVVAVSYRDTAYRGQADDLHENLELHHDEGRTAKFLERAMQATREKALKILGENMKMRMK